MWGFGNYWGGGWLRMESLRMETLWLRWWLGLVIPVTEPEIVILV